MRPIILTLTLLSASCLATSGEIERAVSDITSQVDAVAQRATASAEEAREAWQRGDITYAELQRQLADIRAGVVDVAKETSREVLGDLKDTLNNRPEVVAGVASDTARTLVPGPLGELLGGLLLAGGTYAAARNRSREDARRMSMQRDLARAQRGESTHGSPSAG